MFLTLLCLGAWTVAPAWSAQCIDVRGDRVRVSGQLEYRIFRDKATGQSTIHPDADEAAYLLKLAMPTCFVGDQFLGGQVTISQVHLMVDADENQQLFGQLHALVGKQIVATGKRAFGANSEHHRAPVVVVVEAVSEMQPPRVQSARQAVEAFYLALEVGNGFEAAQNIIPAKRRSGPLSARALSHFYGSLKEPLELLDVVDLDIDRFRAFYQFETSAGARCNGWALVTTTSIESDELIARIIAENGC